LKRERERGMISGA
jgi:hypothetical protein